MRTTYGSILADHVPDRAAESIARLEAAGYVNVGKTTLDERAASSPVSVISRAARSCRSGVAARSRPAFACALDDG